MDELQGSSSKSSELANRKRKTHGDETKRLSLPTTKTKTAKKFCSRSRSPSAQLTVNIRKFPWPTITESDLNAAKQIFEQRIGMDGAFCRYLRRVTFDQVFQGLEDAGSKPHSRMSNMRQWSNLMLQPEGILAACRYVFLHNMTKGRYVSLMQLERSLRNDIMVDYFVNRMDRAVDLENFVPIDSKEGIIIDINEYPVMPQMEFPIHSKTSLKWMSQYGKHWARSYATSNLAEIEECPLKCPRCDAEYSSLSEFVVHMQDSHPYVDLFVCSGCMHAFASKSSWDRHTSHCDSYLSQRSNNEKSASMEYGHAYLMCSDCGAQQQIVSALQGCTKHMEEVSKFFVNHNNENVVLVLLHSTEKEFSNSRPITLRVTTSLDAGYPLKIENGNVKKVNSWKELNYLPEQNFSCPVNNCEETFCADVLLRRHMLCEHLNKPMAAILADFLTNRCSTIDHVLGASIRGTNRDDTSFPSRITFTLPCFQVQPNPQQHMDSNVSKKGPRTRSTKDFGSTMRPAVETVVDGLKNTDTTNDMEWLTDVVSETVELTGAGVIDDRANVEHTHGLFWGLWQCNKCDSILQSLTAVHLHIQECSPETVVLDENNVFVTDYHDLMKILYPPGNLPNGLIKCLYDDCEKKVCSVIALQSHLILVHGCWLKCPTYRRDNQYDPEAFTPSTDKVHEKLNTACFLNEEGTYVDKDAMDVFSYQRSIRCDSMEVNLSLASAPSNSSNNEKAIDLLSHNSATRCDSMEVNLSLASGASNSSNNEKAIHLLSNNSATRCDMDVNLSLASAASNLSSNERTYEAQDTSPSTFEALSFDEAVVDVCAFDECKPSHEEKNAEESESCIIVLDHEDTRVPVRTETKVRNAAFKCKHCFRSYITSRGLDEHVQEVHSTTFNDDAPGEDFGVPLSPQAEGFFCPACLVWRQDRDRHVKHYDSSHANSVKGKQCTECMGLVLNAFDCVENNQRNHFNDHKEDSIFFMCVHCPEPHPTFHTELEYLYHIHVQHKAPLVGYCICSYCSTNLTKVYRHAQQCEMIRPRRILFVAASEVYYYPRNVLQHKKALAANPQNFCKPSLCTHRSLLRSGAKGLTSCPDGVPHCFGTTNAFRFLAIYMANNNIISSAPTLSDLPRGQTVRCTSIIAYVETRTQVEDSICAPARTKTPNDDSSSSPVNCLSSNARQAFANSGSMGSIPALSNARPAVENSGSMGSIPASSNARPAVENSGSMGSIPTTSNARPPGSSSVKPYVPVVRNTGSTGSIPASSNARRAVENPGSMGSIPASSDARPPGSSSVQPPKPVVRNSGSIGSIPASSNARTAVQNTGSTGSIPASSNARPVVRNSGSMGYIQGSSNSGCARPPGPPTFVQIQPAFFSVPPMSSIQLPNANPLGPAVGPADSVMSPELYSITGNQSSLPYLTVAPRPAVSRSNDRPLPVVHLLNTNQSAPLTHMAFGRLVPPMLTQPVTSAAPTSTPTSMVFSSSGGLTEQSSTGSLPMKVKIFCKQPHVKINFSRVPGALEWEAIDREFGSRLANLQDTLSSDIRTALPMIVSCQLCGEISLHGGTMIIDKVFMKQRGIRYMLNMLHSATRGITRDIVNKRRTSLSKMFTTYLPALGMQTLFCCRWHFSVSVNETNAQTVMLRAVTAQIENLSLRELFIPLTKFREHLEKEVYLEDHESTSTAWLLEYHKHADREALGESTLGVTVNEPVDAHLVLPLQANSRLVTVSSRTLSSESQQDVVSRSGANPSSSSSSVGVTIPIVPEIIEQMDRERDVQGDADVTCALGCGQPSKVRYALQFEMRENQRGRWKELLSLAFDDETEVETHLNNLYAAQRPYICVRHFCPLNITMKNGFFAIDRAVDIWYLFKSWGLAAKEVVTEAGLRYWTEVFGVMQMSNLETVGDVLTTWFLVRNNTRCKFEQGRVKCGVKNTLCSPTSLRMHEQHGKLHRGSLYLCEDCVEPTLNSETAVVNHVLTKHLHIANARVYFDLGCPVKKCVFRVHDQIQLRRHLNHAHRDLLPILSDYCATHFHTTLARCVHDTNSHDGNAGRCCILCGMEDWRDVDKCHSMMHALSRTLVCRFCLVPFESWEFLEAHVQCSRCRCPNCPERSGPSSGTTNSLDSPSLVRAHIKQQHGIILFSTKTSTQDRPFVATIGNETAEFIGLPAARTMAMRKL